MIDVAAIRAAVDLPALIGQSVKLQRRGRVWLGLCPFHQERTPSFYVLPGGTRWYCQGCGARGDCLDWIMLREGATLAQAASRLGFGQPLDRATRRRLAQEQAARDAARNEAARREAAISAYRDRNPDCVVPDWALEV